MSIALVFVGNIEFCPYVNNYIEILKEKDINFDIYYWDRAGLKSNLGDNYIPFTLESKLMKNKLVKLLDFFQYYIWINKQLKEKHYNKIILLDTLSSFLVKNRLNKSDYILEIRDYSYENNPLFKNIEKNIIKNSYCTFVSSAGFFEFLPKEQNYVLVHNISSSQKTDSKREKKDINKESLNIVWAGSIRYYSTQMFIISEIKNDSRIKLFYHGTGPQKEKLEKYCVNNNIKNVFFTGRYDEKDKQSLYDDADYVLNAYDTSIGNEVKFALSNRFYDSIIMRLPQIVESGSYKAELVKKYGLGITLNNNFKDELISFYNEYNRELFAEKCNELYKKFSADNDIAKQYIRSFLE